MNSLSFMMFLGLGSLLEREHHNFVCFTGEEPPNDDHDKPEQQRHGKPKDQGEELAKMNLAT